MHTCGGVRVLYGDLSAQICFSDGGTGTQALVETPQEHRKTQNHHLHRTKPRQIQHLNIAVLLLVFALVFLPLTLSHEHTDRHMRADELNVHHEACGGLGARHAAGPRDLSCHRHLQRVQLLQQRPDTHTHLHSQYAAVCISCLINNRKFNRNKKCEIKI